jgi:hypothetical protein
MTREKVEHVVRLIKQIHEWGTSSSDIFRARKRVIEKTDKPAGVNGLHISDLGGGSDGEHQSVPECENMDTQR